MNIPSFLITMEYCYNYLVDQIPIGLLLYSHVPTGAVALLFGVFLLLNARKVQNVTLFIVSLFFALWCLVDLISWFVFIDSSITMFAWSLADFFSLTFFFFSYYFLYTFISKKDLPLWQKFFGLAIILPTAIWTLLGQNLLSYDANTCEALESDVISYLFYAQSVIFLSSIILTAVHYKKATEKENKKEILFAGIGVSVFLGFFLVASLLASFLINYEPLAEYAYNFEIYGLFGMPILLAYLGYLIVRYKAFNLKMFGAQALVFALVALIASQFAFVSLISSQILVAVTLVIVGFVGLVLVRSVKKEIEQREHIEALAIQLDDTNKRQETLIHFIGHEVKGTLTKDAGALSSLSEGDFGPIPEAMKSFIDQAIVESRNGAGSVEGILKASNLKKGTVTYVKEPFDLKLLVADAVERAKLAAKKKGLELSFLTDNSTCQMVGDKAQIADHVLRNLIDNAINYTPSGSVTVSLQRENNKFIIKVKDSGIGITDEDKKLLFTEGGHGKDSIRTNVHSTGYGLYIAKQIVVAQGGSIRAESEGAGKGSTFVIEFPAA